MKKYQIFIVSLLLSAVSCTDETERNEQSNRNFRITASIEDTGIMSRVADRNNKTSFTENDMIFIGWNTSSSYKFLYSGTNDVFVSNATDADRGMWSDLFKNTASEVDVYAWYGTMSNSLPTVGASISIPQDQTSESEMLSAICMAAHQAVSPSTNALNFSFHHLTARLLLSVDIVDDAVTQPDVMDATAQITHIYVEGTIATDASNAYQLSVTNDNKEGTQSIHMKRSWSDQQIYHLDFECLLPPQTLGEGQSVIITLANGKEYVCKISGEIALQAGQKTKLSTELKASEDATIKPKITKIPDAISSSFSGNRLICTIKNTSGEFRYRVYDKQPDGSWGEGVSVYEDEEGTVEFPTDKYKSILKIAGGTEISGDYVILSANAGNGAAYNNAIYFIKKSKNTGVWYCSDGKLLGHGYSICISEDFLVNGNHVSDGNQAPVNHSYIYPIDENGNLGAVQDSPAGISAYKCSIYGDVLATNNGVYKYNADTGEWEHLKGINYPTGNHPRVATDGKRVIVQNGQNTSAVSIYNVETQQEEGWKNGTKPIGGVAKPVAIYGDYALVGNNDNGIKLCYRDPDSGLWSIIGPSGGFLDMMKHWDKTITLTTIEGRNITMKGYRAMIISGGECFFIENIDKMAEDYIANPDSYK